MGSKELAILQDPTVFSMTNLRGVVDRLVSGFFYTKPHSPRCAREGIVVRKAMVWGDGGLKRSWSG